MNRMVTTLGFVSLFGFLYHPIAQCGTKSARKVEGTNGAHLKNVNPSKVNWKQKTSRYWKKVLSRRQFLVCRQGGTERPFTGKHLRNKKPGVFVCSSCGHVLFDAKTKFKSGTGWPSYYDVYKKRGAVKLKVDRSYGMIRLEVKCARCDAHLGHVFRDGPKPTGLRFCINSVCLNHRPYSYAHKHRHAFAKPKKSPKKKKKPTKWSLSVWWKFLRFLWLNPSKLWALKALGHSFLWLTCTGFPYFCDNVFSKTLEWTQDVDLDSHGIGWYVGHFFHFLELWKKALNLNDNWSLLSIESKESLHFVPELKETHDDRST